MTVRPISAKLQEIAKNELNEVHENVQDCIETIKEWLIKQTYINSRTDDQFILNFLRGCKFDLELTKKKIVNFYTMRTASVEFCTNRDPFLLEMQNLFESGFYIPLIRKEHEGPVTVLMRFRATDPEELPISFLMKGALMLLDLIMDEEDNLLAGINLVYDLDNMNMKYVAQTTPRVLKSIMDLLQEAYPLRIKQFHFVNATPGVAPVLNALKWLMNEQFANSYVCYSKGEKYKFTERVPVNILPKEYGGEGPTVQEYIDEWKKRVEDKAKWYQDDAQYGANKNQVNKYLKKVEMYMESTFKHIEID